MLDSVWLPYRRPPSNPRLRLFCFAHAGGSASLFRRWQEQLAPEVEVCAVQLPGRERRFHETLRTNLSALVGEIADAFAPSPIPFAFLGVSMGGWLAFELARELRRRARAMPFHLFIGAIHPPDIPDRDDEHHLSLDAWIERATGRGELSAEELAARDLLELMHPLLAADAALTETHVYVDESPLACPITAYAMTQDRRIVADEVKQWDRHTSGAFEFEMLEGEHNFLKTSPEGMIARVASTLMRRRM
jgi:medium-chain acyl-[acyl-carrier-protein] hydrolase